MPRDYKSRSRRSEPEREGPSAVVWLFVGILIGLIISGIFYLKGQHNNSAPSTKRVEVKKEIAAKRSTVDQAIPPQQTPAASSQNLQTQFDFYSVLPNKKQGQATTQPPAPQSQAQPQSQPAIQTQTVTPQKTPASSTTSPTPSSSNYAVQIATLSKPSDADQLKAQLLLLGFDVNVTPVQKNGQTLERVWLGPFTNKSDATATQKQLQQNQITSNLLKLTA